MVKKLMFLVAMVAGLFASCADNNVIDENQNDGDKKVKLSINADLGSASRVGFTPNGDGLKTSFQEGDYMMVYLRKAGGKWLGKTAVLYYVPGSANGTKGTFAGSIDEIPEETGLLHILMGSTKGGTPYIAAAAGECKLIDDLSTQEGTLEDAALHSVFQADPYTEGNLTIDEAKGTATISNVTFVPKTSVVKIQATFPDGVTVAKGTELTVSTTGTYTKVEISGGNPGGNSTPASATATSTFNVKVAEVNGNVATAYMTIWPGRADNEFGEITIGTEIDGKPYQDTYVKNHEGKLEAGKLYTIETYLGKAMQYKTIWLNDDAADNVVTVEGIGAASDVSWMTVEGGKIKVEANTTGAPRTGKVVTDEYTYTVAQLEVKDFKGSYTFTTKAFAGTGAYKTAADALAFDVTLGDPRKAVTLTDADGTTQHSNNIGITGLYYNAVMDGCIEIDYDNHTAKLGVFFDARPTEAQQITEEGTAKGYYARFIPGLATRSALAWSSPWIYNETNLGDPNYAWAWFTIASDLNTIIYYNRSNNNVEFSTLSQYSSETMNQIVAISVVSTATADATPSGYANVYQVNAKNTAGMNFVRK